MIIGEAQGFREADEFLPQFRGQLLGPPIESGLEVLLVFVNLPEEHDGKLVVVGVRHAHDIALHSKVTFNVTQVELAGLGTWDESSDPVVTVLVPEQDGGDVVAVVFLQLVGGGVHRKLALFFFLECIPGHTHDIPLPLELVILEVGLQWDPVQRWGRDQLWGRVPGLGLQGPEQSEA